MASRQVEFPVCFHTWEMKSTGIDIPESAGRRSAGYDRATRTCHRLLPIGLMRVTNPARRDKKSTVDPQ
ncbi:hypothetical protein KCP75_05510 [Salmonella enterica subsp. enterica]|nr:hypothetical protein KCP75_05510 [Salmonella enterica subsp. enterica]